MNIRAIFIVAGHGLSPTGSIDNGATGYGTTERQEVVEISQDLFAILSADPQFRTVHIEKIGVDNRMTLRDQIDAIQVICSRNGYTSNNALLVSVHINAAGSPEARGVEAWYSRTESNAYEFSAHIVNAVAKETGLPIRRYSTRSSDQNRHGRLGILDDTIPQGCLIECGFITNEFDASFLKDQQLDNLIAQGIHKGIRSFSQLTDAVGPVVVPPTPIVPTKYRDLPQDAWYKNDVNFCLEQKLFAMQPDGLFHPSDPITRAELAVVMARHLRTHHHISL